MDVRDLRYLRALAEHRNFGRAADALGLTQPALTRRVQAVETELEVRLFDRRPKGVELTPFGKLVIERAGDILRGLQNIKTEIDRMVGLDVGAVTLGTGPVVAQTIVGEAVGRLIRAHPQIRVSVFVGGPDELSTWLRDERTDLMIADVTPFGSEPDIEIVSQFEHFGYFFCRPGHPILKSKSPSVQEILSYPFATAHLPGAIFRQFQLALGSDRFSPAVQCDSYPVLKNVVAESDAIGVASRYAIIDELRLGRLTEVPTRGPAVVTALGVARLANREASPAAQALAEELSKSVREVLNWSAKAVEPRRSKRGRG